MVAFSCLRLAADAGGATPANLFFSVSDACHLPFEDRFFDAAFHFGGINLFDDVEGAIGEMNRVVKPGGRVVFGDEGIGPRSEEHTSELQSLMRISYAVFCLKKKNKKLLANKI